MATRKAAGIGGHEEQQEQHPELIFALTCAQFNYIKSMIMWQCQCTKMYQYIIYTGSLENPETLIIELLKLDQTIFIK